MNPFILGFIIIIAAIIALFIIQNAIVINREYERALKFRLGSFQKVLGPGINFKIPFIEDVNKVDYRTKSVNVKPQEVMTRDNVTVSVNAYVFFRVRKDPEELKKAILNVEDYIIGKKELDEILQERDEIADKLRETMDKETDAFGVKVENVEIRDVSVPSGLERAMASQAEAERERRAKIINGLGEVQAARQIRLAAEILGESGYKIRTLQTIDDVARENSTIITIPAEIMPTKKEGEESIFGDIIERIAKGEINIEKAMEELGIEEEIDESKIKELDI